MHSECGYLGFVLIPGPWAGRMGGIGGVGYRVRGPGVGAPRHGSAGHGSDVAVRRRAPGPGAGDARTGGVRPSVDGPDGHTLWGYRPECLPIPPGGINLTSVSEATKARGVTDLPLAADPESTPAPTATVDDAHGDCGCDGECNHHHGYLDNKENYLKRLRRIEGQVRGLQKMVLDEKYCIDILTQISATSKALQSVALAMLDEHMSTCVVRAAREGGDEAEIKLAEASDAIARLVRS